MLKVSILGLTLATAYAWPSVIFLDASERGWVSTGVPNNNGSDAGNNYLAGQLLSNNYRNWFEFSIPAFSGTLNSATLILSQPQPGGHVGDDLVYSVYGLDSQPVQFTDVNDALPYGSVITDSNSNGSVSITLDAAALAAIAGDEGTNFFIGGIDSGEVGSVDAYDFGGTDQRYRSLLSLTTVPEPHSSSPLVIILFGLFGMLRSSPRLKFRVTSF
jgi:hypothetical protein